MLGHRPRTLSPARSARRRERGAVLVEFAMVALIMVTMLAGTFDFGMAWRASLGVTEAARAGARVGSSLSNDISADQSLMTSAQSAMASAGLLEKVTRVVIYKSDQPNGKIPVGCKTNTLSNLCNVFTGTQFRNLGTTPAINAKGCLTGSQSQKWCPTDRVKTQISAEYIGVWVEIEYQYEFRLLGTSRKIERYAVMRLEP